MNNPSKKKARPLLLFYILVAYVFLQFIWWSYLLFNLNNEVYQQKSELILYKSLDESEIIKEGNEFNSKLHKKWIMIVGEGTIFLLILTLGIIQIRKTYKKEIDLAQQQKNFLLSVSHELKSPIASAKLQLQTLQKRELDKEKQNEIIANALVDIERLNSLVDNILLSAKIDNHTSVAAKEKVNLSELIKNSLKTSLSLIQQKTELIIDEGIFYEIDTMSFPSIILNLVENASKYSPKNSIIKLNLKKSNKEIILSVSDEGSGIPENEKKEIFKKFYRIGNEETRKTKGTGLGLYIVKNLVEQHRGKIIVKNNLPKGSIFEITFNT